jgi:hypothetical protein
MYVCVIYINKYWYIHLSAARKAYNNHIHDIISLDQSGNSKRFWSFIKAKNQENSGVALLRGNDGMLHSTSNNKAEILNAQFKSAYTQEDLTNLPDVGRDTIPKFPEIRVKKIFFNSCVVRNFFY